MIVLIGCLIFGCAWVVGKEKVLQRAMWYVASHINTSHDTVTTLALVKMMDIKGDLLCSHLHAHTHQDQVHSCPEKPQGGKKRILENRAIWMRDRMNLKKSSWRINENVRSRRWGSSLPGLRTIVHRWIPRTHSYWTNKEALIRRTEKEAVATSPGSSRRRTLPSIPWEGSTLSPPP